MIRWPNIQAACSRIPIALVVPCCLLLVCFQAEAQIDLNALLKSQEKAAQSAIQKEVATAKKEAAGVEKQIENSAALAASMAHDSIIATLQSEGSMVIDEKTATLVGDLKVPDPPTTVATNSILKVPAGPDPVQLDYEVGKGDSLHIRLNVNRWKSLHSVSVIQGERVLFRRGKTSHKDSLSVSVGVPEDGTVSLRLMNRNFRPATVDVLTGIQPRKKTLVAALKQDTVYVDRHQTAVGKDTTGTFLINAKYVVTPRSDITSRPYMIIPLTVQNDSLDQSPGWAYWIGFTKSALDAYEALKPSMPGGREPLEALALGEWPALPEVSHPELTWTIAGKDQMDRFKRSLPVTPAGSPLVSGKQPRLWNSVKGSISQWQNTPPFLMVRNTSTLNEYTIYVKVIALTIQDAMVQKDDKMPVIQKSILLQYQ